MAGQTEFTKEVIKIVKKIPRGRVASYGQIAKMVGNPQASRGVVWILHSCSDAYRLPWHRVLNSKGMISFPEMTESYIKQRALLEQEEIKFDSSGRVNLDVFRWKRM
mgnify:CR=1 FL=1